MGGAMRKPPILPSLEKEGYVLEGGVLGFGSSAAVWLGRRVRDGARCAVKVTHCPVAEENDGLAKREERGVESLEGLAHPHLLQVYLSCRDPDEGRLVVVMEYAESDLRKLLRS